MSTKDRAFEDWTVDGVTLRRLVAERSGWPEDAGLPGEHPPLRADGFWPRLAVENLRNLLGEGPGDFDDGRVVLLYCAACADLGCGALSAWLVLSGEVVEWRDVAWQDELQPEGEGGAFDAERDGFDPPMSFRFAREPYVALLRDLTDRYAAIAEAAPPAQPRRATSRWWRRRGPIGP